MLIPKCKIQFSKYRNVNYYYTIVRSAEHNYTLNKNENFKLKKKL